MIFFSAASLFILRASMPPRCPVAARLAVRRLLRCTRRHM
jgi:hypothetical protein